MSNKTLTDYLISGGEGSHSGQRLWGARLVKKGGWRGPPQMERSSRG